MKQLLILLTLGVSFHQIQAQTWELIHSNRGTYSFTMPITPSYYDTLGNSLYRAQVGSSLILETHYTDNQAFDFGASDPYQLFVQGVLYNTNGNLESLQSVTQSDVAGKEVGVSYTDPSGVLQFIFTRIFCWNKQVLVFTISSDQAHLATLLNYKTIFFNSIQIQ